jgi:hypothetical protein
VVVHITRHYERMLVESIGKKGTLRVDANYNDNEGVSRCLIDSSYYGDVCTRTGG